MALTAQEQQELAKLKALAAQLPDDSANPPSPVPPAAVTPAPAAALSALKPEIPQMGAEQSGDTELALRKLMEGAKGFGKGAYNIGSGMVNAPFAVAGDLAQAVNPPATVQPGPRLASALPGQPSQGSEALAEAGKGAAGLALGLFPPTAPIMAGIGAIKASDQLRQAEGAQQTGEAMASLLGAEAMRRYGLAGVKSPAATAAMLDQVGAQITGPAKFFFKAASNVAKGVLPEGQMQYTDPTQARLDTMGGFTPQGPEPSAINPKAGASPEPALRERLGTGAGALGTPPPQPRLTPEQIQAQLAERMNAAAQRMAVEQAAAQAQAPAQPALPSSQPRALLPFLPEGQPPSVATPATKVNPATGEIVSEPAGPVPQGQVIVPPAPASTPTAATQAPESAQFFFRPGAAPAEAPPKAVMPFPGAPASPGQPRPGIIQPYSQPHLSRSFQEGAMFGAKFLEDPSANLPENTNPEWDQGFNQAVDLAHKRLQAAKSQTR